MKPLLSSPISFPVAIGIIFLIPYSSLSQNIGIGTNTPNASALLDISSTSKGLLIPRLNAAEMFALANPAEGLMVYNKGDSSLYTKSITGWQKVAYSNENTWKIKNNSIHAQNYSVGIGYSSLADQNYLGSYAPLQVKGLVGNTAAFFGADQRGISIVADYPGVFFNSYFNNGVKSMSPGNVGNITLNQTNNDGGYYEFSFGGYSLGYDFPRPNNIKMLLTSDGKLSVNTGTIPSRAMFEQNGAIGNTNAIFGGDAAGISMQSSWPAIGFNQWDGSTFKSIGPGFGSQIALNLNNGSLLFLTLPYASAANEPFGLIRGFASLSQKGNFGVSTTDAVSDLEIVQKTINNFPLDENLYGLRITEPSSGSSWNVTSYGGGLYFIRNGADQAAIQNDGTYLKLSDRNQKKNIQYFSLKYNALEKVMRLKPATYFMKDEPEDRNSHIGFISQDVEQVIPQIIHDINGRKMMDYTGVIPVLTAGMQEQQQQIEEMKSEIAELKKLLAEKNKSL